MYCILEFFNLTDMDNITIQETDHNAAQKNVHSRLRFLLT